MARTNSAAAKMDDAEAVRDAVLHRIRTEMVETAARELDKLIRDEHTPAGARVQALKLVFDTALAAAPDEDGAKPLSSMSRAELQAASTQAMAVLARLDAETLEIEPEDDVFG